MIKLIEKTSEIKKSNIVYLVDDKADIKKLDFLNLDKKICDALRGRQENGLDFEKNNSQASELLSGLGPLKIFKNGSELVKSLQALIDADVAKYQEQELSVEVDVNKYQVQDLLAEVDLNGNQLQNYPVVLYVEKDQDQEGIPDIAQDQMPKTHRQLRLSLLDNFLLEILKIN